jgi:acyl-CoA synthetase (AMP-forming)/AMP-acid ligase II
MGEETQTDVSENRESEALIRLRLGPGDARYGGDLVAGATAMAIFGDLETELAIRTYGDEGLCVAYHSVEFLAPLRPGDTSRAGLDRLSGPDEPPDPGRTPQGDRSRGGRTRRGPPATDPRGARGGDDRLRAAERWVTRESLVDALLRIVTAGPGRPAIQAGGTVWSYADLWDRSGRIGTSLLARLGLRPGDRVGILGQNDPGYLAAYFGILRAGCVAVPLNQFLLGAELADQLELVGARLCLIGRIDEATAGIVAGRVPSAVIGDLLGETDVALPRVDARADATILLTSGTTGTPKGAVQSHATMRFAVSELQGALPFSAEDVMLAFLPFFAAIPEQILPTLLAGGAVEVLPRFELAAAEEACSRATTLDAVPTIMARPDGIDHARLARLRWVMFASEPMPPALLTSWWKALPAVRTYEFYGMTEMLTITVATPDTLRAAPDSVGRPFPGSTVSVVDAEGRSIPVGESGEVVCASPARMRGYLPEGIDPSTWSLPSGAMRTGDLGRFDDGGRLVLTGRIKDLIISGGMNVPPTEIEAVAASHPAVASAMAVGIPDARWGETPIVIAIRWGASLTPPSCHLLSSGSPQSAPGRRSSSGSHDRSASPRAALRDEILSGA